MWDRIVSLLSPLCLSSSHKSSMGMRSTLLAGQLILQRSVNGLTAVRTEEKRHLEDVRRLEFNCPR